ncbi:MAG: 1-deoxy-D-xylulose-5-phosphate synthase, partial [Oscillospiraceae bacterium]|nr:1-deoxy-D-xylulose-5-phosphate synthase [Oscillospiraceae bacterium]
MAAGLAKQGMIPVVAIYSTFLQRAFDMLLHDVSILNLHVVFAVDRAGLVGADGETHHGMFDVGYLRQIPGMQVLCPASAEELKRMLRIAVLQMKGPVAVRYPTGCEGEYTACNLTALLREGRDCTVVTYGTMINQVLEAEKLCEQERISLEIFKLPAVSPIDFEQIAKSVQKTKCIIVMEECANQGCVADDIFSYLEQKGIRAICRKRNLGDGFVTHGSISQLLEDKKLDAQSLYRLVLEVVGHEA